MIHATVPPHRFVNATDGSGSRSSRRPHKMWLAWLARAARGVKGVWKHFARHCSLASTGIATPSGEWQHLHYWQGFAGIAGGYDAHVYQNWPVAEFPFRPPLQTALRRRQHCRGALPTTVFARSTALTGSARSKSPSSLRLCASAATPTAAPPNPHSRLHRRLSSRSPPSPRASCCQSRPLPPRCTVLRRRLAAVTLLAAT